MELELKKKTMLTIATSFPNFDNSYIASIFVKNQILSIKKEFKEIIVCSTITKGLKSTIDLKKFNDYSIENVKVYFAKSSINPMKSMKLRGGRYNVIKRMIKKKKINFDFIHAHYGGTGLNFGVKLKNEFNVPLITSFYGFDAYFSPIQSINYNPLIENGDLFIVLSNHMKEKLIELGFPKDKIYINRIGIDCEKFNFVEKSLVPEKTTNLLSIALFVEQKGIFDAINAFRKAVEKNSNIRFTIVGDGPLKDEILNLINQLNLSDKIEIIDNIHSPNPRQIVMDELKKADIFMLPSKIASNGNSEGTPVALMEASAVGLPCITTQHSGNPEVIIHKKTGLVCEEGNIDQLSDAIIELAGDYNERIELGKNGREFILENYNNKIQGKKLLEIYRLLEI